MIRVAIVDDYPMIRETLKRYLGICHDMSVVMEAGHGRDFINRLFISTELPDVVVMDVQMPVMDGYQAARYLSLHYPCIKILGMSANEEAGRQMLACGASFFLPKCVDGEKIAAAIHTLAGS